MNVSTSTEAAVDRPNALPDLPETLARVAESQGAGAALRFAHEFGGQEIWVPKTLGPDHRLVKRLGKDLAQAIVAIFGHGELLVPLGPASDHRRRGVEIVKLLRAQHSPNDIAGRLRCHIKTVRRYKRKLRAGGAQLEMFPHTGTAVPVPSKTAQG